MKKFRLFSLIVVVLLPIFGTIILGTSSGAFALSEEEYRILVQSSPEYRKAEKELAIAWKKAVQSLKKTEGMAIRELRDDQRDWIATKRDAEAEAYMAKGMKKAAAYTKVTRERTAYLSTFVR